MAGEVFAFKCHRGEGSNGIFSCCLDRKENCKMLPRNAFVFSFVRYSNGHFDIDNTSIAMKHRNISSILYIIAT